MSLTEKQKQYLMVIDKFHIEQGTPPTLSKVGGLLSIPFDKRSTVSRFITRLCDAGYLEKGELLNGSSRCVWLSKKGMDAIK